MITVKAWTAHLEDTRAVTFGRYNKTQAHITSDRPRDPPSPPPSIFWPEAWKSQVFEESLPREISSALALKHSAPWLLVEGPGSHEKSTGVYYPHTTSDLFTHLLLKQWDPRSIWDPERQHPRGFDQHTAANLVPSHCRYSHTTTHLLLLCRSFSCMTILLLPILVSF